MTWSYLREHFVRVLILSTAFALVLTLAVEGRLDWLTWLALTAVALLACVVGATTVWALDRQDSPRRRRPG